MPSWSGLINRGRPKPNGFRFHRISKFGLPKERHRLNGRNSLYTASITTLFCFPLFLLHYPSVFSFMFFFSGDSFPSFLFGEKRCRGMSQPSLRAKYEEWILLYYYSIFYANYSARLSSCCTMMQNGDSCTYGLLLRHIFSRASPRANDEKWMGGRNVLDYGCIKWKTDIGSALANDPRTKLVLLVGRMIESRRENACAEFLRLRLISDKSFKKTSLCAYHSSKGTC